MANILGRVGDAAKRYGRALTGSDARKLKKAYKASTAEMEAFLPTMREDVNNLYKRKKVMDDLDVQKMNLSSKGVDFNSLDSFENFINNNKDFINKSVSENKKTMDTLRKSKDNVAKSIKLMERNDELKEAYHKARANSIKARAGTLIGGELLLSAKPVSDRIKKAKEKKQEEIRNQRHEWAMKAANTRQKNKEMRAVYNDYLNSQHKTASEYLNDLYIEKMSSITYD